jgi:hypothetical protein
LFAGSQVENPEETGKSVVAEPARGSVVTEPASGSVESGVGVPRNDQFFNEDGEGKKGNDESLSGII